MDRSQIPPTNWLQFDVKNQEFYGTPVREDEGRKEYQLVRYCKYCFLSVFLVCAHICIIICSSLLDPVLFSVFPYSCHCCYSLCVSGFSLFSVWVLHWAQSSLLNLSLLFWHQILSKWFLWLLIKIIINWVIFIIVGHLFFIDTFTDISQPPFFVFLSFLFPNFQPYYTKCSISLQTNMRKNVYNSHAILCHRNWRVNVKFQK